MSEFNKRKINNAIDNIVNQSINLVDEDTTEIYKDLDISWEDLTQLQQSLGQETVNFVTQVMSMVNNPSIVNNLGDDREIFKSTIEIFLRDIHNLSLDIQKLRQKHEGKTGKIENYNDYQLYNEISGKYSNLYTDITLSLTPVITDLIFLANKAKLRNFDNESSNTVVEDEAIFTNNGVKTNE